MKLQRKGDRPIRFKEDMKESLKKYKEVYEPYASGRDLMGMPHTTYTLDENGGICLDDAYEGSIGIESKFRISAFNNSNLTKYEVPKTVEKIIYDKENILMQCGEKINTIQFYSGADSLLKVKDLDFSALTSVFSNVLLSQIMFRYPGIENRMYSSKISNANFEQVKGVIPKDGIFKDITTLVCDTGDGIGVKMSSLGIVNLESVDSYNNVSILFSYCNIKKLVVPEKLLNAGIVIATNSNIKVLEIYGESKTTINKSLFSGCTIDRIIYVTTKVPSNMFDGCTIGDIQFGSSNNVTRGLLSKTPLEKIESNAFNRIIFTEPVSIATVECDTKAFDKCIFQNSNSFIFTNSKLAPMENVSLLPYDVKIIRMPVQQQQLYAKANEILYKLRNKKECKPY